MKKLIFTLCLCIVLFAVAFVVSCDKTNSNTSSNPSSSAFNETIIISNYKIDTSKMINREIVDELDVDEAINSELVQDYDEGELKNHKEEKPQKFNDEWVAAKNIPDVKTTDDYREYLKKKLQMDYNRAYDEKMDKYIWSSIKPSCKWNKKPEKKIKEIFEKYAMDFSDDEMDNGLKIILMENAEEEAMHREAIYLLAEKNGIHVSEKNIETEKKLLMDELNSNERDLSQIYSHEDLEYEALKHKVSNYLYAQSLALANN